MEAVRQGDVLLRSATIPIGAKRVKLRPIALGETTGHHHSLMADPGVALEDAAEMYEVKNEDGVTTYIRATEEGIRLVHQQHKATPEIEVRGTEPEHPKVGESLRSPVEGFVYVPQVENSDWGTRPVVD